MNLKLISELWSYLSIERKRQYKVLIGLIVISSIAELFTIGAIFPFVSALGSPDAVMKNRAFGYIFSLFYIEGYKEVQLFLTIAFSLAILLATFTRTLLLWRTVKLAFGTGADLTQLIFRRAVNQDYQIHKNRNSTSITDIISIKVNEVIQYSLMPAIFLVSSVVISSLMILVLVFLLPIRALGLILGLAFLYVFILKKSKAILNENSKVISKRSAWNVRILQETQGGIRDVIVNDLRGHFCNLLSENDKLLRDAQVSTQFISQFPRFSMEALGMLALIVLAYSSVNAGSSGAVFPLLAALAISAQRLLPALQQMYSSRTLIEGSKQSLVEVLKLLSSSAEIIRAPQNTKSEFHFGDSIEFRKVGFKYLNSNLFVIKDVNFRINRGDKVGIMGSTGCGKSTLVDILMGLLEPDEGGVFIDGIQLDKDNVDKWLRSISHVPQTIFLTDGTIAENIAFGCLPDEIDYKRIETAAKIAMISDEIAKMPFGYQTRVGEMGGLLSGGQRQRLGIARALYKNTKVLVLDEATSALDVETEAQLIKFIAEMFPDITLIMIAHRLATLDVCNKILKVESGIVHIESRMT